MAPRHESSQTALLCLLQFADSALPIGSAAHSFGLESLVDLSLLSPDSLESFLGAYLEEVGTLEAAYCFAGCQLSQLATGTDGLAAWLQCNAELGARKVARESREASAAMGRRLLNLAANVSASPLLTDAARHSANTGEPVHLAACFGLVSGVMHIDPIMAATAFLQQSITSLIYCCQRLMPLGQTRAHQTLWNLQPIIVRAAAQGASTPARRAGCFAALLDIASARHPGLRTRLYMS